MSGRVVRDQVVQLRRPVGRRSRSRSTPRPTRSCGRTARRCLVRDRGRRGPGARRAAAVTRPLIPARRRQEILRAVRAGSTHVGELAQTLRRVGDDRPARPARARARGDGRAGPRRRGAGGRRAAVRGDGGRAVRGEGPDRRGRRGARAGRPDRDDRHRDDDAAGGAPPARPPASPWSRRASRCSRSWCPTRRSSSCCPAALVRRNYRSLVGVLAEDSLRQLQADVLFLGASAVDGALRGVGLHDGRGADQAGDDRGGRARRAARRRGEVRRAAAACACARRTRSTCSSPTRRRRVDAEPGSRSCSREADDRRRRRLPRAARLRRAARQGGAARPRGGRAARRRRRPARADRRGARRARGGARRAAAVPRDDRPRRRARGRPTTCSARSAPAGSRAAWSTSRCRSRSACSGRRRPGRAGSASRCGRSRRWSRWPRRWRRRAPGAWLINFTNPAGMVTEAVQQVLGERAIGVCDSPSGLCRRVARALGRDARRALVRLLRAQPPRLAQGRPRPRRRAARPGCSPTTRRSRASRRGGCSAASGCGRSR